MNESTNIVTIGWNAVALKAIALTHTPMPAAARLLAILHTAIYDAWSVYDRNSISTSTALYIKHHEQCSEEDIRKAISHAAFSVLTASFWDQLPSDQQHIFRHYMHECGCNYDDASIDIHTAQGIGNLSARLVLASRNGDGANSKGLPYFAKPWQDLTGFHPRNEPWPAFPKNMHLWQPLSSGEGQPQIFLLAHWPLVRPFALKHPAHFRASPPCHPEERPSDFRRQAEEVLYISQHLSEEQKAIAQYWWDGDGTITSAGHWCEIAHYVAGACHGYNEAQCVKLFFALGNALLDASITAWETKRAYESARPVTIIRHLLRRKEWESYLPTPPYPAYVSGHNTLAFAAAAILKHFTGSDDFEAAGVLEKGSSVLEPGQPPEDIQLPLWTSFSAAATQAGLSRLYGGVQFRGSIEEGGRTGTQAGDHVWAKALHYFNDQ